MSKTSKYIIAVSVALALIGIVVIAAIPHTSQNKYAVEAVRVLEKYKNFDIDAKEAANRIDSLIDEVYEKKSVTLDEKEEHTLLMLWLDLISIHTKLYHNGSATGYEIDEAINKIKAEQ